MVGGQSHTEQVPAPQAECFHRISAADYLTETAGAVQVTAESHTWTQTVVVDNGNKQVERHGADRNDLPKVGPDCRHLLPVGVLGVSVSAVVPDHAVQISTDFHAHWVESELRKVKLAGWTNGGPQSPCWPHTRQVLLEEGDEHSSTF